jgi:hypothetical protein
MGDLHHGLCPDGDVRPALAAAIPRGKLGKEHEEAGHDGAHL